MYKTLSSLCILLFVIISSQSSSDWNSMGFDPDRLECEAEITPWLVCGFDQFTEPLWGLYSSATKWDSDKWLWPNPYSIRHHSDSQGKKICKLHVWTRSYSFRSTQEKMQTSLAAELIKQISIYLSRQSECWLERNFQTQSIAERSELTKSRDNVEHSGLNSWETKKIRQNPVIRVGRLTGEPTDGRIDSEGH